MDNHTVSFCNIDGGNGPLVVDANNRSIVKSIRIRSHPRDVPVKHVGGGLRDTKNCETRYCI